MKDFSRLHALFNKVQNLFHVGYVRLDPVKKVLVIGATYIGPKHGFARVTDGLKESFYKDRAAQFKDVVGRTLIEYNNQSGGRIRKVKGYRIEYSAQSI